MRRAYAVTGIVDCESRRVARTGTRASAMLAASNPCPLARSRQLLSARPVLAVCFALSSISISCVCWLIRCFRCCCCCCPRRLEPAHVVVCYPALGALAGAWLGAFPIPLDHDLPYQVCSRHEGTVSRSARIWITHSSFSSCYAPLLILVATRTSNGRSRAALVR